MDIRIIPGAGQINFSTDSIINAAGIHLSEEGIVTLKRTSLNSDETVFSIDGFNGRLFSVVDNMEGVIFSANTISGMPVIEARSDYSSYLKGPVGIGISLPIETLDIEGSAGFAKRKYYSGYTNNMGVGVGLGVPIKLNEEHGATLNTSWSYKVSLTTVYTDALTGASYLVFYDFTNSTWVCRDISKNGMTSNHPLLSVSGSSLLAWTNHVNTVYDIRYHVESIYNHEDAGTPHIFGADYGWQRYSHNLYYQDGPVGIGVSGLTPLGATLDVDGTGKFTGTVTIAAGTSTSHAVRGDRSITISSGNGITGGSATAQNLTTNRSWTLGLTGQALALHVLATNGIIARTGAATVSARTLTGTANRVLITNGDGVSGNPTFNLPQDIHTGATPQFNGVDISSYIRHIGDTNTLMGFTGNDTWTVHTGGTARLNINSSGEVAATSLMSSPIFKSNTASSRAKFKMYGDSVDYAIGMQAGVTYGNLGDWAMTFQFSNAPNRGFWWGDTGHSVSQGAMALTTDGRLTLAKSLSVGEGEITTSPSQTALYVGHSQNSSNNVAEFRNTSSGQAAYTEVVLGNDILLEGFTLALSSSTNSNGANIAYIVQRSNAPLKLYTNGTERVTINGDGKVGIGTSSPTDFLSVRKDANADTALSIVNNTDGTLARSILKVGPSGFGALLASTRSSYTAVSGWALKGVLHTESGLTGGLKLSTHSGNIEFNPGGRGNALIVTDSGSKGFIGINTSSPSYELEVSGSIYSSSWIRTGGATGWYSQTYGGGWYMKDVNFIRNHNNKSLYLEGSGVNQGTLLFDNMIGSASYTSGFAGNGTRLDQDENNHWHLGLDNLTVRGRMRIYELLINQIRATNGSVWVSSTGKVETVWNGSVSSSSIDPDYPSNGLIAHYNFNSIFANGSEIKDFSGNENHAIKNGSLLPVDSSTGVGKYMPFSGSETVIAGDLGLLPDSGSISFWFSYDGPIDPSNPDNILSTNAESIYETIRFEISESSGVRVFTADTTNNLNTNSSGAIATDTWYMVTFLWNKSVGSTELYLGNTRVSNRASGAVLPNTIPNFAIGVGYSSSRKFKGKIEEVRLYNKALTSKQIELLYENRGGIKIKTDETEHGFLEGDLIRAQRFNGSGIYKSDATVTWVENDLRTFYVEPKSVNLPEKDYEYVRIGNAFDAARQGAVYLTSDDDNSPFIDIIDTVNSHSSFNTSGKVKARLGKLSGVTSPVFGQLKGYGLWSQNMYLEGNAQISGTLTAGDANGVGNTFYAGRIRKNLAKNINTEYIPNSAANTVITANQEDVFGGTSAIRIQNINSTGSSTWVYTRTEVYTSGIYTISMWIKGTATLSLQHASVDALVYNNATDQENPVIAIGSSTSSWERVSLVIRVEGVGHSILKLDLGPDQELLICGLQLEEGELLTPYQPTDSSILGSDNGFGMWASAGGFGGTLQNPIISLNSYGLVLRNAGTSYNTTTPNNSIAIGNFSSYGNSSISLTNTGVSSTSGLFATDATGNKVVELKLDGNHVLAGWAIGPSAISKGQAEINSTEDGAYFAIQGTKGYGNAGIYLGESSSSATQASFFQDNDNKILFDSTSGITLASENFTLKGGTTLLLNTTKLALGTSASANTVANNSVGTVLDNGGGFKSYGDADNYIRRSGTTLDIKSETFSLSSTGLKITSGIQAAVSGDIVLSGGNNQLYVGTGVNLDGATTGKIKVGSTVLLDGASTGKLALGTNASTLSTTAGTGFYVDGAGKFKVGTTTQYIRFNQTANVLEIETPKLKVDTAGNVSMTGTVTASAGLIAGWTISDDSISKGNTTTSALDFPRIYMHSGDTVFDNSLYKSNETTFKGFGIQWHASSNAGLIQVGELPVNSTGNFINTDNGFTTGWYGIIAGRYNSDDPYFQLSFNTKSEGISAKNLIAGWEFDVNKLFSSNILLDSLNEVIALGGTDYASSKIGFLGTGKGKIGNININGVSGALTSGQAFVDTFNANSIDTDLWSVNGANSSLSVNGAYRLVNDNVVDSWELAIVSKKSFSRSNSPVFIFDVKILMQSDTVTPADGTGSYPRFMVSATDTVSATSYLQGKHNVYFADTDIRIYEENALRQVSGTTDIVTDNSVGDTFRIIIKPRNPGGFDLTIYRNGDFSNPIHSSTKEENGTSNTNGANLRPAIFALAGVQTFEVVSVMAYDSTTVGAFDLKSGGGLGLISKSGNNLLFNRDGLSFSTQNTTLDISGNLIATNANLSGKITANDGLIAGWDINANNISSGNIELSSTGYIKQTDNKWVLNSDGSGQLASGNISWDTSGELYLSNVKKNLLEYTHALSWEAGPTPTSLKGWTYNGTAAEQKFELDEDPFGNLSTIWKGIGTSDNATGGAEGTWIPINSKKNYVFTIFLRRTGTDGSAYFGFHASQNGSSVSNVVYFKSSPEPQEYIETHNPYFYTGDLPSLNKWYLIRAYVLNEDHPNDFNFGSHGGVYDVETGKKVSSVHTHKMKDVTTHLRPRFYQYYNTTPDVETWFYSPGMFLADGTEPSVADLIKMSGTTLNNYMVSSPTIIGGVDGGARVQLDSLGLSSYDASNVQRVNIGSDGSGWLGALDKISWDTSGNITLGASVTLSWSSIDSRPTSLNDLDSTANSKLNGISAGATVGASWGTNLNNIPTDLVYDSDIGAIAALDNIGITNLNTTVVSNNKIITGLIDANAVFANIGSFTHSLGVGTTNPISLDGASSSIYSSGGGWALFGDGSGQLASGNISWDTSGDTYFTGTISAGITPSIPYFFVGDLNKNKVKNLPNWTTSNTTVTGGQTDLHGGSEAYLVEASGTGIYCSFSPPIINGLIPGSLITFSIFVKRITANNIVLYDETNNTERVTINLTNNTVISALPTGVIGRIEDIGDDWVRVSMTYTVIGTSVKPVLWIGTYSGVNFSGDSVLAFAPQIELGSYPTPYQKTENTLNDELIYPGLWASRGGFGGSTTQTPRIALQTEGIIVRKDDGDTTWLGNNTISMGYSGPTWGIIGKSSSETIFQLGSTNQIAGWDINANKLFNSTDNEYIGLHSSSDSNIIDFFEDSGALSNFTLAGANQTSIVSGKLHVRNAAGVTAWGHSANITAPLYRSRSPKVIFEFEILTAGKNVMIGFSNNPGYTSYSSPAGKVYFDSSSIKYYEGGTSYSGTGLTSAVNDTFKVEITALAAGGQYVEIYKNGATNPSATKTFGSSTEEILYPVIAVYQNTATIAISKITVYTSTVPFITIGNLSDKITSTTNRGIFMESTGDVLFKAGSTADKDYLKFSSSGLELNTDNFSIDNSGNVTVVGSVTVTGGNASTRDYVQSRGQNLVTNGTGLMGDNTNFSKFTFNPADTPEGAGSFNYYQDINTRVQFSDEPIPINPESSYYFKLWAKSEIISNDPRYYIGYSPFDVQGLQISPSHHLSFPGATYTTLAADLNVNDTTITLVDATGWQNAGGATGAHQRSIRFYPYIDSNDYEYDDMEGSGYSRRVWSNVWDDGGINGNVITLRSPWSGIAYPAGTKVMNATSGGTYVYNVRSLDPLSADWKVYTGVALSGSYVPGTKAIKWVFLSNYKENTSVPDARGRLHIAGLEISEMVETGKLGSTIISGGKIVTGLLTASNIKAGLLESINYNADSGSSFDLATGTFKLGGSSSPKLSWNGSALEIDGKITATSGTVGGWNIGTNAIINSDTLANVFLYSKGYEFDTSFGVVPAPGPNTRVSSMAGLLIRRYAADNSSNRVILALGETYDGGLTGRLGISFTRGKDSTIAKYFEISTDLEQPNGAAPDIKAQIAGWNFTENRLYSGVTNQYTGLNSGTGTTKAFFTGAEFSTGGGAKTFLCADGSGQLADGKVSWSAGGDITFGDGVIMEWKGGGANLIDVTNMHTYDTYQDKTLLSYNESTRTISTTHTWEGANYSVRQPWTFSITGFTPENDWYTLSGYVTFNNVVPTENQWFGNSSTTRQASTDNSETLRNFYDPTTGRFEITEKYGSTGWVFHKYSMLEANTVIKLKDLKFERGVLVSDWSPSPTVVSGNYIKTGELTSTNYTTTTGSKFKLNDGSLKLGGSSDSLGVLIKGDGSGYLASGKISWSVDGDVDVSGYLSIAGNGYSSAFYAGPIKSNLLTNSQDFSSITKANLTINGTNNLSPENRNNATKITESSGTTQYRFSDTYGLLPSSGFYTFSIFVRKETFDDRQFYIGLTTGVPKGRVYVKLDTGSIQAKPEDIGTMGNYFTTDYGNYWRVSLTANLIHTSPLVIYYGMAYNNNETYTNTVFPKRSMYIWGKQLVKGKSPLPYQKTGPTLSTSEDFGMWASSGGFGGTSQDPQIMLNDNGLVVRKSNTTNTWLGDDTISIGYKADNEWGIIGKSSSETIFQLGSTNQIAGWEFDNRSLRYSTDTAYIGLHNKSTGQVIDFSTAVNPLTDFTFTGANQTSVVGDKLHVRNAAGVNAWSHAITHNTTLKRSNRPKIVFDLTILKTEGSYGAPRAMVGFATSLTQSTSASYNSDGGKIYFNVVNGGIIAFYEGNTRFDVNALQHNRVINVGDKLRAEITALSSGQFVEIFREGEAVPSLTYTFGDSIVEDLYPVIAVFEEVATLAISKITVYESTIPYISVGDLDSLNTGTTNKGVYIDGKGDVLFKAGNISNKDYLLFNSTGLEIEGKITATTGTIGGFDINENFLQKLVDGKPFTLIGTDHELIGPYSLRNIENWVSSSSQTIFSTFGLSPTYALGGYGFDYGYNATYSGFTSFKSARWNQVSNHAVNAQNYSVVTHKLSIGLTGTAAYNNNLGNLTSASTKVNIIISLNKRSNAAQLNEGPDGGIIDIIKITGPDTYETLNGSKVVIITNSLGVNGELFVTGIEIEVSSTLTDSYYFANIGYNTASPSGVVQSNVTFMLSHKFELRSTRYLSNGVWITDPKGTYNITERTINNFDEITSKKLIAKNYEAASVQSVLSYEPSYATLTSISVSNTDSGIKFYISDTGQAELGMTLTKDKNLNVANNLTATGNVTANSDISLKVNIAHLSNPKTEQLIKSLLPSYYWRIDRQSWEYGFIAQEVQEILPSLVIQNDLTGLLSLDYGRLSTVAIAGVKRNMDEIDILKSEIKRLKTLLKKNGIN